MAGGAGDDVYVVNALGDIVTETTGQGFDIIYALSGYVLAAGVDVERLSSADHLTTTAMDLTGNDITTDIYGNAGANVLTGGAANNNIFGFSGNDTLNGLGGQDSLLGMDGDDTLNGGADNDYLVGGAGYDILTGGTGDDIYVVEGGSTTNYTLNDPIYELAGEGIDLVYAIGDYWLYAGPAHVELLSSADSASTVGQDLTGNDHVRHIYGNNGRNTLIGGEADNTILGLGGNDLLRGGGGDDVLDGGAGIDIMTGGNGNDRFHVDDSGDVILDAPKSHIPAAGNDTVYTSVDYRVDDEIETLVTTNSAGTANLRLFGSVFDNSITGNAGDNVLDTGQGGTDSLTGLGGADIFSFRNMSFPPVGFASNPLGVATIQDFQVGADKIRLDLTKFTAITAASTGFFEVGTTATSASTRILYDPATGNLLYDVDGNAGGTGADPGKLFGRLQTGLSLTAGDFILQANQAPEAHDDNYALNVGATDTLINIYPQQNDFDLDGLRLWVTRVGVGSGPMVDIGVGQDRTFVGGVFGTLQSHGNKSNFFDYWLDVDDPDTLAIAPGTTVFETYTYEVTDGMREGTAVGTLADFALFDQATITIAITRSASGGLMSTVSASDALAAPAPADDQAAFASAPDAAFAPIGGGEELAASPSVRAAADYLAPDLWIV
jgi:Ca2+-binding RTX toxin-like protein